MPVRVVVLGGTGRLGRRVVDRLRRDDRAVARAVSRRAVEAPGANGVEHVVADVERGIGLTEALAGADAVIHLTHSGADATRRLLAVARDAGVSRVTYVSIIGADRIPLPYYAMKVEAERAVREVGIPATVVRAAQFHSFIDDYLATLAGLPLPGLFPAAARFQSVDEREVADHVVGVTLDASPAGSTEVAGPELLTLGEMARQWFAARSMPRRAVPGTPAPDGAYVPEPWAVGTTDGFVRGLNTPAGAHERGSVTWADYLRERYAPAAG
ncbi:MAG TPA: NmrA family NAD(P)-binding protein [Candidatus Limnocylindria bacterium]|nr:NmrA family NAD(P)-binding protein [Candidatus Limnocylindria bacterium]